MELICPGNHFGAWGGVKQRDLRKDKPGNSNCGGGRGVRCAPRNHQRTSLNGQRGTIREGGVLKRGKGNTEVKKGRGERNGSFLSSRKTSARSSTVDKGRKECNHPQPETEPGRDKNVIPSIEPRARSRCVVGTRMQRP